MKQFFAFLLVLLALVSVTLAAPVLAQEAPVGIVGNVTAPNNQGLEKAVVLVLYGPTQARYTTSTDAAGNFAVGNLAVGGPYSVQVSQPGFQPQKIDNIFLLAGKTANGTFVLFPKEKGGGQAPNRDYLTYIQQCRILLPGEVSAQAGTTPAPAPLPAPAAPLAATPAVARTGYQPGSRSAARVVVPLTDGHYDAKSGYYIYHTGPPVTLRLPDGQLLRNVGGQSTENQLFQFLSNPRQQVDTVDRTRGWISFDRVFFTTGQATLTPESRNQLKNIALLLQSYPRARLKLGGYTDSVGTYPMNRQLSEARARTAWAALVEMGVSPARLDARGYGPNYPLAANRTPAGRAQNRRLSLRVLMK